MTTFTANLPSSLHNPSITQCISLCTLVTLKISVIFSLNGFGEAADTSGHNRPTCKLQVRLGNGSK
ncbi:hypothetical protein Hanom_Chr05g00411661 [Helianthus anomalus]